MKNKYLLVLCALTLLLSLACEALIGSPLAFEPDSLPAAQVGEAYEAEMHITENRTPVGDFSISKGALPTGLELVKVEGVENTARISGIPEQAGTFTFTVHVWCYGTNVPGEEGDKEYSIVVEK